MKKIKLNILGTTLCSIDTINIANVLLFYFLFSTYRNYLMYLFIWWYFFILICLMFDFCRFCVVIRFVHLRHNGQWPPTSKDFYTRSYPSHYFLILILEKESVFPFSMFNAKQGNYWCHFYNVFGMTRSLTGHWTRDLPHSKPALYH